jgi:hypothetical protein
LGKTYICRRVRSFATFIEQLLHFNTMNLKYKVPLEGGGFQPKFSIRKQWVNLLSGVWEEANRLHLAYGSRGRKYFRFSFEPGEIGGSF